MSHPETLKGKRVVITRTREQASELAAKLTALGADVLELPVLKITKDIQKHELADAMLELGSYDWLVFTSANGVTYFFEEFFRLFDDIRSLGLMRIATVGDATAKKIAELHLKIECQPEKATGEALAAALIATGSLDNAKILAVTGNLNRDTLVVKLEEARAIVDRFQVYKTEKVDLALSGDAERYRQEGADAVLFASSSSVEAFLGQGEALKLGPKAKKPLFGSIGPQTTETMKEHSVPVAFEADPPGIDTLITALVAKLSK